MITVRRFWRLLVSTIISVLLVTACFAVFPQFGLRSAAASTILPASNMEYSNGTITSSYSPLSIWYDWVNISGTQLLYYALYTDPEYPYPVPIANIIGQHFSLADGTEVFIASALSELEVYRDLNGDGIPQTNGGSGENELLYYMYSNMSEGYSMTPIQKTTNDEVPHYCWSFTYQNPYAYLQSATERVGVIARMFLEHLTLNYDFSVNGNTTNLKTSFDIGKVTNLEILEPAQFSSFDGLSLALLYATATYTTTSFSTSVNGQPYNSATANTEVEAEIAEVEVEGVKAYDFVFGGNYSLHTATDRETHQTSIETFEAKAQALPIAGLPTIYTPTVRSISFFEDQLNLTGLFGGSWPKINAKYESSSLIYRICFPAWDGMQIEHDPVFIGYVFSNQEIPEIPIVIIILPIMVTASLILTAIKKRKHFTFSL